jgi:hypothetical protein
MGEENSAATEIPGRGHSSKKWSDTFQQKREVSDVPFLESYRATGNCRGLVQTFLQEDPSPIPSRSIERGKTFFSEGQIDPQVSHLPPRAWVLSYRGSDNASFGRPKRMSASQIAQEFEQQVCCLYGYEMPEA